MNDDHEPSKAPDGDDSEYRKNLDFLRRIAQKKAHDPNNSSASDAESIPGVQITLPKQRVHQLDAEIQLAKKNAADSHDVHSVWIALKELALSNTPPFTGSMDKEKGLQYTNASEELDYFSKDALRKRMNPNAR